MCIITSNSSLKFLKMDKSFNMWSVACTANLYAHELSKFGDVLPPGVRDFEVKPVFGECSTTSELWSATLRIPEILIKHIRYYQMTFMLDMTFVAHRRWLDYWTELTETAADYDIDRLTPAERMKLWLRFAGNLNKGDVQYLGGYWLTAILNDNKRPKFIEYIWEESLLG